MKKRLKISKKIYVSPLVEFEEIEQDELDMMLAGTNNTVGGGGTSGGTGGGNLFPGGSSLDLGFEEIEESSSENSISSDGYDDFLINELY